MYVRKVQKGGKTYLYYYKSKRVGNKVKSIYVGRALEASKIEKPKIKHFVKESIKKSNKKDLINNLLSFDNLLNELHKLIDIKDLGGAIHIYNEMFEIYSKLELNYQDKTKLFEKLNLTYNNLLELSKELNIKLE